MRRETLHNLRTKEPSSGAGLRFSHRKPAFTLAKRHKSPWGK
jgi:hypothetical protein